MTGFDLRVLLEYRGQDRIVSALCGAVVGGHILPTISIDNVERLMSVLEILHAKPDHLDWCDQEFISVVEEEAHNTLRDVLEVADQMLLNDPPLSQLPSRFHGGCLILGRGYVLNPFSRTIIKDGVCITVAPKWYGLLRYMAEHRGEALGVKQIFQNVWGSDCPSDILTVRTTVHHIRKAFGSLHPDDWLIKTVRGFGFRMPYMDEI